MLFGGLLCACEIQVMNADSSKPLQRSKWYKRLWSSENSFQKIRISYNLEYLNKTTTDSQMCHSVGEIIQWNGYNYACTSSDIITSDKITTFQDTFKSTVEYVENLIKVDPYEGTIGVSTNTNYKSVKTTTITNSDLHVLVFVRPFASDTLFTSSQPYVVDNIESFRPILGVVYVNARTIPTSNNDYNSPSNFYFQVLLESFLKIMVFNEEIIPNFHVKETYERYDVINCSFTKFNRVFKVLATPYAHNFAIRHYHVETFVGDNSSCPSGIFYENYNNFEAYAGESIFYADDLSVLYFAIVDGKRVNRLTDMTLSFILDTGNYEVNWSMAQPLIYGNVDAIDGVFRDGWPLSPPATIFPEYFYDPSDPTNTISYDYNGWFIPENETINCTVLTDFNIKDFCQAPQWYNPNGYTVWGLNSYYDRQLIRLPTFGCSPGTATIPGLTYYEDDKCGSYSCNGYSSFTIDIIIDERDNSTTTLNCTQEGQKFSFTRTYSDGNVSSLRTVTCPKPERFCRTRNLLDYYFESDPFTNVLMPTPKPTPIETPKPTPKPTPLATPVVNFDTRFQKIRITSDYRYINGTKYDSQICHRTGERITDKFGTFQCTDADLMTTAKYNALITTIENVKTYLTNLLRVDPLQEPINTVAESSTVYTGGENITNSDLHLIFFGHPMTTSYPKFYPNTIKYESNYRRIIQINIFVNIKLLTIYPSDDSGVNSTTFNLLLNKIFYGIVGNAFTLSQLHPKFSNQTYDNIFCSFNYNGKDFKVLQTPYSHIYAVKHYGVETYVGNVTCTSGILVDDNGLPNPIIYLQDILVDSIQFDSGPFSKVTDVTLAYLLDTGNYDVDWSFAKPSVYGNKDYINGSYIPNWPLGPPLTTLPPFTFNNPYNITYSVGFEFNWWGAPSSQLSINCSNIPTGYEDFCKNQDYYDPKRYNLVPNDNEDDYAYQFLNYPVKFCEEGKATIPGMTFLDDDVCGNYRCSEDYSYFEIDVPLDLTTGEIHTLNCTHAGIEYSYTENLTTYLRNKTAICPDPERFCRVRNGLNKIFTTDPFSIESPLLTPVVTPHQTPLYTPSVTPHQTPLYTPSVTPDITISTSGNTSAGTHTPQYTNLIPKISKIYTEERRQRSSNSKLIIIALNSWYYAE